ncbi:MAG: Asp/Glu racemase [Alphaproteobacteria bacterium]|nr:Asp/Glu racemase [Alphaproteobacteria bacterium]
MAPRILVINPNSDEDVTASLDAALGGLRFAGGPTIECLTLAEAPPGIQTAMDSAVVVPPLVRLALSHADRADAFVIACFGDPGLHAVREAVKMPVVGIGEAGLTLALNLGERIGVITNLDSDIVGHLRQARMLGVADRLAGVRAVGIPVVGLADEARSLPAMIEAGRRLVAEDGANVLVPACAGMTRYADRLRASTGVPVVDATVAAVAVTLAAVGGAFQPAR